MNAERIVKTICNLCGQGCGLDVHVKDERIVKVSPMAEHVFNTLCPKAQSQPVIEWVYSRERLTNPLRKVNGEFKEVSWDDALDFIVDKLDRIKRQHGAKAVAYHTGNAFISTQVERLAMLLCDLYGTPNFTSGAAFCDYAKRFAHSLTFDYEGVFAYPCWRDSSCAIIWGANPCESVHVVVPMINALQQRGGKLVVIDPRITPLAKRADIYAQVRPGTDCALALGLLNVIITEELYDRDFVEKWTTGFDKLAEHVKGYPPEKVEELTWVPVETIKAIARTYAQSKSACIFEGVALEHINNGVQSSRALAILMAITGNIDIPGGNAWPSRGSHFKNLRIKREDRTSFEEGIGAEYPIFNRFARERSAVCLPNAILDEKPYPITALFVQGANPMLIWPNTHRTEMALNKLDLLVVIDLFMTDTAKLADVVLPCTTFLERKSWKDYIAIGLPLVAIGNQSIAPIGNSLPDWEIIAELARKMGFEERFPWKSEDEIFQYLLEPLGITLERFQQEPEGVFYAKSEQQRYLREGFNTPSGKVEIYSETLGKYGYAPLPTFEEPGESLRSRPDMAETYPFILITGSKTRYFTHSRFRNIPSLRERVPEPVVEINSKAAEEIGIVQGEVVTVQSPRGSIRLKALLTNDIHPRVVSIQHGWSEANVNLLIDDMVRDPISSFPAFKSSLCRIAKK